jgi:hypothetical protein
VCIDQSEGLGPLAKRGVLVRGTGHARVRGEIASVALEVERTTHWKGFDVATTPAGSAQPSSVSPT